RRRDWTLPHNYKSKKRRSTYDNSISIFLDEDGHQGFRVHSNRGRPWAEVLADLCRELGLETWAETRERERAEAQEEKKDRASKGNWIAARYVKENDALCRDNDNRLTGEQHRLMVNDLRIAKVNPDDIAERMAPLGSRYQLEQAMKAKWQGYTAKE